ncbi:MAG: V-type ATP synthase subunit E family protein [Bacteroidaceae bacterium]
MADKIQELTNKIYQEGVEKANDKAKTIISDAQKEADRILTEAKKEAAEVIEKAKRENSELEKSTKAEVKMYANQALNALKSEITNLITDQLVKIPIKDFVKDQEFLSKFIVELASKWSIDEPIIISTAEAESLNKYFATHAKQLLDKEVTIKKVNDIDTLFSISPVDGSYKINFGEDEFINYFKEFLRPQLIEMLF